MKKSKRVLIVKIVLVLILIVVIALALYNREVNKPFSEQAAEVIFVVNSGDGVKKISKNLADNNLINSRFLFETYVKKEGVESALKAGSYQLFRDMSISQITAVLVSGDTISTERDIKIIEGWRSGDIADYLAEANIFSREDVLQEIKQTGKYASQFDFIKHIPQGHDLEGFLFPDTYRVYKDASIEDVVTKMLANFDKKLSPEFRAEISKQGRNLYDVIILASIIEKEVRSVEDMKMIAGVFSNRLSVGQPLQTDATLAYILGIDKPIYSLDDTKVDSPYNTYANAGLPPGPISNPGLKAIEAAIYPSDTDYNYFLSASETGETIFAKTFAEHIVNKAKYLK